MEPQQTHDFTLVNFRRIRANVDRVGNEGHIVHAGLCQGGGIRRRRRHRHRRHSRYHQQQRRRRRCCHYFWCHKETIYSMTILTSTV